MITNANITIYNKYIDPETRSEKFQRTQIIDPSSQNSVFWGKIKASSVLGSGGNIAATSVNLFIPFVRGEDYLEPKAWQALSLKTGKWTLQIGDFVVKGLVADDIDEDFTVTDLKNKYDDVVSISSISPMNDIGSFSMRHWELAAK